MNNVDFIIGGWQKCATTWLHDCLSSSHEVYLPKGKKDECYFFSGEETRAQKDFEEQYRIGRAKRVGELIVSGDSSVDYVIDIEATKKLYGCNERMKVILCVRDPLERSISAAKWTMRKGKMLEQDLNSALKRCIYEFDSDKDLRRNKYSSVIGRSLYSERIDELIEVVPTRQLLVINYSEIQRNPRRVLGAVCDFLGVDLNTISSKRIAARPKVSIDSNMMMSLERRFSGVRGLSKAIDVVSQNVYRIRGGRNQNEEIHDWVIGDLKSRFSDDIASFNKMMAGKKYYIGSDLR